MLLRLALTLTFLGLSASAGNTIGSCLKEFCTASGEEQESELYYLLQSVGYNFSSCTFNPAKQSGELVERKCQNPTADKNVVVTCRTHYNNVHIPDKVRCFSGFVDERGTCDQIFQGFVEFSLKVRQDCGRTAIRQRRQTKTTTTETSTTTTQTTTTTKSTTTTSSSAAEESVA